MTKTIIDNKSINKSFGWKRVALLLLATTVILGVFWWLKLVGITMAGEAFCGLDEHVHTEACLAEGCTKQEHTHIEICYSNIEADLESQSDWDASVAGIELTGVLVDDIVAIAKSQLGYTESTLNYVLDSDGNRAGYNRYGAWHGNPYGDWSALFADFCLYYSGISESIVPYNSGEEAMRLEWDQAGHYASVDDHKVGKGDIVFLDKDGNGSADAVAIVSAVDGEKLSVIEGDLDNAVAETEYQQNDVALMGYGTVLSVMKKTVSAEKAEYVNIVERMIDKLPSIEEVDEKLLSLEEDMEAYEAYYISLLKEINLADMVYEDLDDVCTMLVTNADKLNDLLQYYTLPSVYTVDRSIVSLNQTGSYIIHQYDALDWMGWRYSILINDITIAQLFTPDSVANNGDEWMASFTFDEWVGYRIEYNANSGMYYVAEIYPASGSKRNKVNTTEYGFMFFVRPQFNNNGTVQGVPICNDIKVGDSVRTKLPCSEYYYLSVALPGYTDVSTLPYSARVSAVNATTKLPVTDGIGHILFGINAQEYESDNTNFLQGTVSGVPDTTGFMDINLYNYDGNQINTLWQSTSAQAYPYPGFQRPAPMTNNFSALSVNTFSFGDLVVSDLGEGTAVGDYAQFYKVWDRDASVGINRLYPGYEARRSTEGAMYPLLVDEQPVLANGTTKLGYLFGNGSPSYIQKQNTKNITGLFQYDAASETYWFDSRQNHAQWDASTNTFKLYKDEITPSPVMYPFGNFMPFNDIVYDSTPVTIKTSKANSTVKSQHLDRSYYIKMASSAWAMYNRTGEDRYRNLAEVMESFLGLTGEFTSAWDVLYSYSKTYGASNSATSYGALYDMVASKGNYDNLYTIDYDVESDFFFGMDIHYDFVQPVGGLVGQNNDDMVFKFTGDDDVWVYIDGVLFLDLSGIHSHVGGEIDFATGTVKYYGCDNFAGDVLTTPYKQYTFAEILNKAGRSTSGVLNANGTFIDNSVHSFHFYYMERGSGSSMCSIEFNIRAVPHNHIEIAKEVSVDNAIGAPYYNFQVLDYDASVAQQKFVLLVAGGTEYSVYDTKTNRFIETRTADANGIIKIKAGETAMIGNIVPETKFTVRELFDVNSDDQYSSAIVGNGTPSNVTEVTIGGVTYIPVYSEVLQAGTTTMTETLSTNIAMSGNYKGGTWTRVNTGGYSDGGYSTVTTSTNAFVTSHKGELNDGIISVENAQTSSNVVEMHRFNSATVADTDWTKLYAGNINIYFDFTSNQTISAVDVYALLRYNASATGAAYKGYPDRVEVWVYSSSAYGDGHADGKKLGEISKANAEFYNGSPYCKRYLVSGSPLTGKRVLVKLYVDTVTAATGTLSVTNYGSGYISLTEIKMWNSTGVVNTENTVNVGVENIVDESQYSTLEIRKNLTDYTGAERDFTFDLSFDGVPVPVGTVYDIYNYDAATGTYVDSGTDGTVTTAGQVTFSSLQSVKFNNILADTKIDLSEVESGIYEVTYSYSYLKDGVVVTDINPFSDTNGVVSGNFAVSTDHIVTVNNTANPTRIHLPIGKNLLGATQGEYTYNIMIQQVADALGTPLTNGFFLNKAIVVNADNGYAVNEVVTLVYGASDGLGDTFFKVYEENNHLPGYDNNYYIFKVTLTQSAAGRISATTELVKYSADGTSQGEATDAIFTNNLVGVLSVSKVVEGITDTSGTFEFTVNVLNGTTPLTGTFECTDTAGVISSVTFENGKTVISLSHGQTVQIKNLPLGSTWTVTESQADGYQTAYQLADSETRTSGKISTGTVSNGSGVTYYNVGGYELPATNGSLVRHVLPYIGIAVMLLAFLGACIIRYRRKNSN